MPQPTLNSACLQQWQGKTRTAHSFIDSRSVAQMQSIIAYQPAPKLGGELPNLWHWMYTFPLLPLDFLHADGHPSDDGFMPPVDLPQRMWAGGRVQFMAPLNVGAQMDTLSTIKNIALKKGRSGALCFVTLLHQFSSGGQLCVTEEHDIVYRQQPTAADVAAPIKAALAAHWSTQITPSAMLLFRYSAATFNSHRIHYDRDYALAEGYPGLVLQGPLTTTLLLRELQQRNPTKRVTHFSFKAISPLFDTAPFSLHGANIDGHSAQLWAANLDGAIAIQANAEFA